MKISRLIPGAVVLLSLAGSLPLAQAFVHPGVSYTQADLDRMKNNRTVEPYKTAFERFTQLGYSSSSNTGQGPTVTGNQFVIRNDAQVVHNNAIMWSMTGNTTYRTNAINIMNGWANTLTNFDPNDHLTAGEAAKNFCEGAEIIRATGGGAWAAADITNFKNMLVNELLPALITPGNSLSPSTGLLQAAGHGGTQISGLIAMGIFCDRQDIYDFGVASMQRYANTSYGLREYIHSSGHTYENSRDVGHSAGNLGNFTRIARMTWNQGLDLFALGGNLLAKAYEHQAKFDLGWDVAPIDFTAPDGSFHGKMSGDGRTAFDGLASDLALHFYGTIKGLKLPYTAMSARLKYPNSGWGFLDLMGPATGQVPTVPLIGEPAPTGVRLYEDYLSGSYLTNLQPGSYNSAALASAGYRRNGSGPASSMKVPIGWTVTLYDGNLSGNSIQVTGTMQNQGVINLGDIGWNDRPVSLTVTGGGTWPIFNGTYKLVARHSGKVAQVAGSSTADGGNVEQGTYDGGLNQLWRVEATGNGQFKLLNLNSGKALQVSGAFLGNGGATASVAGNIDQFAYVESPNLATGGTATASGGGGGEGPAQAFDGNTGTKWLGPTATGWLQYQLPTARAVNQYRITSANDVPERDPAGWQFQGSNTGAANSWVTLDTRSGQTFPNRFQTVTYSIANTTNYLYYRLNVTANLGGGSYGIQLSELGLYSSLVGGVHQRWAITPAPGAGYASYLRFLNVNSGKSMDVFGGGTGDGVNIMQWTPSSGNNQQWTLQVP